MTIFDKIIAGEIPATKVYETDSSLAFLDIHPVTKGHTLLVPKTGYGRIQEVPDDVIAELFVTAKKLIRTMIERLPCDFVQVEVVGKDIPDHFHIHLIPRMENDTLTPHETLSYESPDEMFSYAQKIIDGIK